VGHQAVEGAARLMRSWEELKEFSLGNEAVVGLLLSGSRGRGLDRPSSDWDCYLVTTGSIFHEGPTTFDPPLEVSVLTVDEFRVSGTPDAVDAWQAYAFVHIEVTIDKLDGEIAEIAAGKEFLDAAVAKRQSRERLDEYINSAVRAAKCARDGQSEGAVLDAAASIAPAIASLFAFEARIPPYNRFLTRELRKHPLAKLIRSQAETLPALLAEVATGRETSSESLFAVMEPIARDAGLGDVIDDWDESALALVRGSKG
jgi:hypothetical protein